MSFDARPPIDVVRGRAPWVVEDDHNGRPILRCRRCTARQLVLYPGDEDQLRSFVMGHVDCEASAGSRVGQPPGASGVSYSAPKPKSPPVASTSEQRAFARDHRADRASWHTPPAPKAASKGRRDIDDNDEGGAPW